MSRPGLVLERSETGRVGEKLASRHLEDAGFVVRQRNWRCRYGEIDLVCDDGAVVVFVEVRTLRTKRFGRPEASVDLGKRRSLVRAGQIWLKLHRCNQRPVRFDVVAVELGEGDPVIRHHRGAFDATGAAL